MRETKLLAITATLACSAFFAACSSVDVQNNKSAYVKGDAESRAEYEQRYRELIDNCRKYGIRPNSDCDLPDTYSLKKSPMYNFYQSDTDTIEYQ